MKTEEIIQKQRQELKETIDRFENELMAQTTNNIQEIIHLHEQYRNKK